MELYEAIAHAREVAQNRVGVCDEYRAEHLQLADWLEELAAYRATGMKPREILSPVEMAKLACAALELKWYKETGLSSDEVLALVRASGSDERLTYKSENDEHWYLKDGVTVRGFDKLAAYENTGRTPEWVREMAKAEDKGCLMIGEVAEYD